MVAKQVHLAAHFPGVNNTTVWSDPAAGSHIEFSSFREFARIAEDAKFDFLFLAEGLRLREQGGKIYDLDVVGRRTRSPSWRRWRRSPIASGWRARSTPPSTSRTRWRGSSRRLTTCPAGGPPGTW
jgi:hypothetical protein